MGGLRVHGKGDKERRVIDALGRVVEARRAGHVVPSQRPLRGLFRLVRWGAGRCPGSVGAAIAAWTRTWPVAWVADLRVSDGPVLGPFRDRATAIAAEERWLWRRSAQ